MPEEKPKRGGARSGAGRPRKYPSGERGRDVSFYLTPSQEQAVREFIERLRQADLESKNDE